MSEPVQDYDGRVVNHQPQRIADVDVTSVDYSNSNITDGFWIQPKASGVVKVEDMFGNTASPSCLEGVCYPWRISKIYSTGSDVKTFTIHY